MRVREHILHFILLMRRSGWKKCAFIAFCTPEDYARRKEGQTEKKTGKKINGNNIHFAFHLISSMFPKLIEIAEHVRCSMHANQHKQPILIFVLVVRVSFHSIDVSLRDYCIEKRTKQKEKYAEEKTSLSLFATSRTRSDRERKEWKWTNNKNQFASWNSKRWFYFVQHILKCVLWLREQLLTFIFLLILSSGFSPFIVWSKNVDIFFLFLLFLSRMHTLKSIYNKKK